MSLQRQTKFIQNTVANILNKKLKSSKNLGIVLQSLDTEKAKIRKTFKNCADFWSLRNVDWVRLLCHVKGTVA